MSIDVQTEIRNTCLYDGGHFAVLMAMADCANTSTGEGIYPGMDLLAANARLKQRRTQDIVLELRQDLVVILQSEDGEDLGPEVSPMGGRGRKTEYRIDLERVQTLQGLHEAEVAAGRVKCHFCDARKKRAEWRAAKGAISRTKGAIPSVKGAKNDGKGAIPGAHIRTHEPSLEPSGGTGAPPPQADLLEEVDPPPPVLTPAQTLAAAYDAYGETAERAGWAAVQMRTPTRDKHLKARLDDAGGLEGWKAALVKAEASDFCCGRAPPRPGKPPFFADFDFLTQQSSFVKLMEGKYDNRQGASAPASSIDIAARVAARRAADRANGKTAH